MPKLYFMPISSEDKKKALEAFDFSKSLTKTGDFLVVFYNKYNEFDGYRIWKTNPEEIAKKEINLIAENIKTADNLPAEVNVMLEYLFPSEFTRLKKELTNIIADICGIANDIESNDPQIVGAFTSKLNNLLKEFEDANGDC